MTPTLLPDRASQIEDSCNLSTEILRSRLPKLQVETISDEFWHAAERHLPEEAKLNLERIEHPLPGQGRRRRPVHPRRILQAIVYVVIHEISWYQLPETEFGLSYGTAAISFRRWGRDGYFSRLFTVGLAGHQEWEGIAWHWEKCGGIWMQKPLPDGIEVRSIKPRSRQGSTTLFQAAHAPARRIKILFRKGR